MNDSFNDTCMMREVYRLGTCKLMYLPVQAIGNYITLTARTRY